MAISGDWGWMGFWLLLLHCHNTHPASTPHPHPPPLSPTLLQQVDVSLPSFCHWSPSPCMPWLLAEQQYGSVWRTRGTYSSESFSCFRAHRGLDFRSGNMNGCIYLLIGWIGDWFSSTFEQYLQYLHTEISEGGNWAISVNGLWKCMETAFIMYLLRYIIHDEKWEYLLGTLS